MIRGVIRRGYAMLSCFFPRLMVRRASAGLHDSQRRVLPQSSVVFLNLRGQVARARRESWSGIGALFYFLDIKGPVRNTIHRLSAKRHNISFSYLQTP